MRSGNKFRLNYEIPSPLRERVRVRGEVRIGFTIEYTNIINSRTRPYSSARIERRTSNPQVGGSNPSGGAKKFSLISAPIVTPECIYRGSTRICLPSTPRSSLHSNELIGWRSRTSVMGNPPRGHLRNFVSKQSQLRRVIPKCSY